MDKKQLSIDGLGCGEYGTEQGDNLVYNTTPKGDGRGRGSSYMDGDGCGDGSNFSKTIPRGGWSNGGGDPSHG